MNKKILFFALLLVCLFAVMTIATSALEIQTDTTPIVDSVPSSIAFYLMTDTLVVQSQLGEVPDPNSSQFIIYQYNGEIRYLVFDATPTVSFMYGQCSFSFVLGNLLSYRWTNAGWFAFNPGFLGSNVMINPNSIIYSSFAIPTGDGASFTEANPSFVFGEGSMNVYAIKSYKQQVYNLLTGSGGSTGGSYEDGYSAGLEDGYNEGYSEGKPEGYLEGFDDGYESGLEQGLEDGYNEGYSEGKPEGYLEGFDDGYESGLAASDEDIYDSGYESGFRDGYEEAVTGDAEDAYNEGYYNGEIQGRFDGYFVGYEEGKKHGYNEGYDVGFAEGSGSGEGGSSTSGYDEGYAKGFTDGQASMQTQMDDLLANIEEQKQNSYDTGYTKGLTDGEKMYRPIGFTEGKASMQKEMDDLLANIEEQKQISYDSGFEDGYDAGVQESAGDSYNLGYGHGIEAGKELCETERHEEIIALAMVKGAENEKGKWQMEIAKLKDDNQYAYSRGYTDALNTNKSVLEYVDTVFSAPLNFLYEAFDVEIFGINIFNVMMFVLSIIIVGIVIFFVMKFR